MVAPSTGCVSTPPVPWLEASVAPEVLTWRWGTRSWHCVSGSLRLALPALSERELLTLLIRGGVRGASASDLAGSVLGWGGGLRAIASARPEELAGLTGIGLAKASALVAAFELGRRADLPDERVVLRGVEDVARIAQHRLGGLRRERVIVLVCDGAHRLRRVITVSEGAMDRSLVPVREILNAVLRHDGRAFALAHNHPGDDAEPSQADIRATDAVCRAAKVSGLRFLGHVVVAQDAWSEVS